MRRIELLTFAAFIGMLITMSMELHISIVIFGVDTLLGLLAIYKCY